MSSSDWFLYALRCADDTLYTGVTTDVPRRLAEHNSGQGARYTSGRRPLKLVGAWRFADRSAAQRAEASFRRLPRRHKLRHVARELPVAGSPFCRDGAVSEHLEPVGFCPRCGGLLTLTRQPGDDRERQVCTACGRFHYRNAKPCAGALVARDGHLLLVKRAIEPCLGRWDIPGGFLEADEHPEAGAIREVQEETGLTVEPTDLFGIYLDCYSSDGRGVPCLNIYYSARVVGGSERAGDDAAEVAWFAPDDLPTDVAFDHARQVLAEWAERTRAAPED
ncbi:MAG: NUDIX domain-containing protein [Chloroflexota bacterium]|nr:NUDIX domain-containing protein [Chloroflexota bacterium]